MIHLPGRAGPLILDGSECYQAICFQALREHSCVSGGIPPGRFTVLAVYQC